jgi:hypothetical protein
MCPPGEVFPVFLGFLVDPLVRLSRSLSCSLMRNIEKACFDVSHALLYGEVVCRRVDPSPCTMPLHLSLEVVGKSQVDTWTFHREKWEVFPTNSTILHYSAAFNRLHRHLQIE